MADGLLARKVADLRDLLAHEATPMPGTSRAEGRPHSHPRARNVPRYTLTGTRLPGSVRVPPDCPRPVRGRCVCATDGSWRPVVGVVRADSIASLSWGIPPERLRGARGTGLVWVDQVYVRAPDGLWHCRWPARRALERIRGGSTMDHAVVTALLRGVPVERAWGAPGPPPSPEMAALRVVERTLRWAEEERVGEWEHRPRQWWDAPRKPAPPAKSDAQITAEAVA